VIYRETKRERGLGFFSFFGFPFTYLACWEIREVVGACRETVRRKSKVTQWGGGCAVSPANANPPVGVAIAVRRDFGSEVPGGGGEGGVFLLSGLGSARDSHIYVRRVCLAGGIDIYVWMQKSGLPTLSVQRYLHAENGSCVYVSWVCTYVCRVATVEGTGDVILAPKSPWTAIGSIQLDWMSGHPPTKLKRARFPPIITPFSLPDMVAPLQESITDGGNQWTLYIICAELPYIGPHSHVGVFIPRKSIESAFE